MTLKELRRKVTETLADGGVSSAEAEAMLLLMYAFGLDKTQVLTKEMTVTDAMVISVRALANRRLHGEPIQYIIGGTEFMSLNFWVDKNVLIPRPETELLVETVIERLRRQGTEGAGIVDVGSGSGCIGISLAHYLTDIHVTGIDISPEAVALAQRNAERNRVEKRVHFITYDICRGFPSLAHPVDFVVSNPPYIPTQEISNLQIEVAGYEPFAALDGGEDGLLFYRSIAGSAPLKAGGGLAFEIGFDQGADVADIMERAGFAEIEILQDLEQRDRVVIGIKK